MAPAMPISDDAGHLIVIHTEVPLISDAPPNSIARPDSLECPTEAVVSFSRG